MTVNGSVGSVEGEVIIQGNHQKNAQQFVNQGTVVTQSAPLMIWTNEMTNQKDFVSGTTVTVQTQRLLNDSGGKIAGKKVVSAATQFENRGLLQGDEECTLPRLNGLHNQGQIVGGKLTFVVNELRNTGTIQGSDNSQFEVQRSFSDNSQSKIILDRATIGMPSSTLALYGTFQITSPRSWRAYERYSYVPISSHNFYVKSGAQLILEDLKLKWGDFQNEGHITLRNTEAIGTGTYYASGSSVTTLTGWWFKLQAHRFNKNGITRAPHGVKMTCGSEGSNWGRYESGGDMEFVVPSGVSSRSASQNFMGVNWRDSTIATGKGLTVNATNTNMNLTSPVSFMGRMKMNLRSLTNSHELSANGLTVNASQYAANTGLMYSGDRLEIQASSFENSGSGQVGAVKDVTITTTSDLRNSSPTTWGGLRHVGQARIFSQNGDVNLTSRYGTIRNDFATIHGWNLHMDSRYAIDNTGYLLAFDRYGTSTFSAPTLRNSCQYTERNVTHYRPETESYYRTETYKGTNVWSFLTFGMYRPTRTRQVLDYRTVQRPYTVVEISAQSTPGQIFLAGNCQVEANRCYVEGGSLIVGGTLAECLGAESILPGSND